MRLRTYQDALVNHTTPALWREGKCRVVWALPTGAGKTACAEALIVRIRLADWAPVYYFAHTAELVTQPGDRLRGQVEFSYLRAGALGDPTCGVQVCSAQTAIRRELRPIPRADGSSYQRCVVFIDEAHRVRTSTYNSILARLAEIYTYVYVVMMTATPYRRDGRGFASAADALIEPVTPLEGFAQGWLVDPHMYTRPPADPESPTSSAIVGDAVAEWRARAGGAATIVRCVNRAHARDVAERFRASGARAAHIDATMSVAARELLLARLAIGGCASDHPLALDHLCSGGTILEEGFDSAASYRHVLARPDLWPRRASGTELSAPGEEMVRGLVARSADDAPPRYRPLGCLVDMAPSTARAAWIQRLGRVARAFGQADAAAWAGRGLEADVKPIAVAISLAGNLERHGFLAQHCGFQLADDRTGAAPIRESAYPQFRPAPLRQCESCFAVLQGPWCAACGAAAPPPALPKEDASVELRRAVWNPEAPPPDSDEQKEEFLRAQWGLWAKKRDERAASGQQPYSYWWAAVRYKAKYGAWPDQALYRAVAREFGASLPSRRA